MRQINEKLEERIMYYKKEISNLKDLLVHPPTMADQGIWQHKLANYKGRLQGLEEARYCVEPCSNGA